MAGPAAKQCGISIGLLLAALALQASAEKTNAVEQLTEQLQAERIISGQFIQQRWLEGLDKPLQSEGQFTYWRDQGIYWQTDQPFPQAITYSRDKTTVWKQPGLPVGTASNTRRDKHFRTILLSLFSFDIDQLQQQFSSRWTLDDSAWQLQLTPTHTIAQRAIKQASLSGAEHIEHIEIISGNGETLQIHFSNLQRLESISHQQCVNQFDYSIDHCQQLTQPSQ